MTAERRHIPFERVFNFRDLGGYVTRDGHSVRWGRLFRAAELQRMTPQEADRARSELGIATVIDLRTDEEADDPRGLGPMVSPPVVRHALGMGDPRAKYRAQQSGEWRPNYVSTLEGGADQFVSAVRLLAVEESYPAVFHCVTGKDRTGVLAALVLDALGVDEETIVEDYAASQHHMDLLVEQMRAGGVLKPDERPNPALGVSPPAMREMLSALRETHGSARGYLAAHGVDEPTVDRMATLLLE